MRGLIPTAEVLRVIDRSDTQLRALRRQGRFVDAAKSQIGSEGWARFEARRDPKMAAHSRERSAFESTSRSKQS